jgi:predicted phage replisome organizer
MFDDEKIKIIESMPDRDAILIIWIKLIGLAAKINSNGWIFLTEAMPYDMNTLATVLNRPVNTVKLALSLFKKYEMIETGNNGSIFLTNFEKHQNIEGLDRIREQGRLRTAKFREKQKLLPQGNVTDRYSNAPDKNREDKNRKEKNRVEKEREEGGSGGKPSPSSATLHLDIYNEFINNFSFCFGHQPNAKELAQIRDLSHELAEYNCQPGIIKDALKEATKLNKMHLSYVRAVLFAWLGVKR